MDIRSTNFLSALAITLGCALVAVSLYTSNTPAQADADITIERPVSADQRVYGSSRASVKLIEFSDYECPFCARIHPTLKKLVDDSGGQVAWEYRHLPLRSHPLAAPAAVIAECVAQAKGNDAFWSFTNTLFEQQAQITEDFIRTTAVGLGLSDAAITACQTDEVLAALVAQDTDAARALGAAGTPFTVILYPDNTYKTVPGAVPYEQWLSLLVGYVE